MNGGYRPAGPRPWGRRSRRTLAAALPAAVLLAVLAGSWQLFAAQNPYDLPTLGAIGSQLGQHPMEYLDAAGTTLEESLLGLAVSFMVAFGLAVVINQSRLVERAVMPVAVVLSVTPVVAVAPGLAVVFPLQSVLPRFIVTGIVVFFPILVNSLLGLRSADREAVQYFASLHASRREVLVHLRLPSSLPFLMAAARICFPLSVVGAVVAEFTVSGNANGLGSLVQLGANSVELAQIYAAVACLALIGLAFTLLIVAVERKALSWHPAGSAP